MIRIDEEVAEKAKNLGLSISKCCENSLIQAIEALASVSYVKEGGTGTVGSCVAGPAGIEPTTTGLKARCSILAELRAHRDIPWSPDLKVNSELFRLLTVRVSLCINVLYSFGILSPMCCSPYLY